LCLELLKNYNIFKKPIKVKEIQHIVNNLGLKRTKGYESTAVKTFVHKRGLNIKYKKKDIGVKLSMNHQKFILHGTSCIFTRR